MPITQCGLRAVSLRGEGLVTPDKVDHASTQPQPQTKRGLAALYAESPTRTDLALANSVKNQPLFRERSHHVRSSGLRSRNDGSER
jgi:hypothetical protein